jgi:hypothetical protein
MVVLACPCSSVELLLIFVKGLHIDMLSICACRVASNAAVRLQLDYTRLYQIA